MKRLRPIFAATFVVFASNAAAAAPVPVAPLEQNKALIVEFFSAFSNSVYTGIADPRLDAIVAKDYQQHETGIAQGLDGLKAYLAKLHATIPDLTCKPTELIAEADRVVDRTACSYHDRRSNQTATDITIDAFRIAGGKLVEHTNWSE